MKKTCVIFFATVVSFAQLGYSSTALRGDFTDWDPGSNLSVDDSYGLGNYSTITVPGISGTANYKFYSSDAGVTWLGGGTSAAANGSTGEARKDGSGNLTVASSASKYYTFRIEGQDNWWNRNYVVMETSGFPSTISSVSDSSTSSETNDVTVSISSASILHPEETLYVRWSIDAFSSSTISTASGSGTNYTATIPGQAVASDVIYYVFSSTLPSGTVTSDPDLSVLRGNNNSDLNYSYTVAGVSLGNCWHHPNNSEPQGTTMRNPRHPYADQAVYFYTGNQFQGAGNPGDQTGGLVIHRLQGSASWSSNALAFDTEVENNKYWLASIAADTYVPTNVVEYYLLATYSDYDDTYIGTINNIVGTSFASAAEAETNPFTFTFAGEAGEEPGYMWHASNVVALTETTAQFWIKIGYAQGTGSDRWADNCAIYYTTNGTDPVITGLGVPGNADTFTQPLIFDHMEEDAFEGGDSMWWQTTLTNLPSGGGSLTKYKIGSWNSAGNGVERFAEYNTLEGGADQIFEFTTYQAGADGLQVNGQNANYTTTKFFIDEIDGDTVQVVVHYKPDDAPNVKNVEVYSNLDRRDLVNVDYNNAYITPDGYPDGIAPPDGNLISTNDTGSYFTAFPMVGGPIDYYWTGTVSRCGAYRLTARHQDVAESSPTNWIWYSTDGIRDHAIVVSPTKVHEMTLYELNTLTVNADSATEAGRSTFDDLHDAGNGKFNLEWLDLLQANCLWFQPIHPSADTTRGDPSGYTPGSPYATKDYFAVAKWFGDAGTEADAMQEFTNFVSACDSYTGSVGSINIMLDGVFNHTAWDAQMGQGGVDLGFTASPTDSMGATRPAWYALWTDYGEPATFYTDVFSNDIATAPDRGDFGKWDDVAELYFGKYSALVRHNPDDNNNYKNEGDVYDYTSMSSDTKDLWKYFGHYTTFWLEKTGHAGTNLWIQAEDDKGLDALRCDFGQGLPPQFWEYFINHTRTMKWNFVFMAETLDGGVPGYRSNRHFDILNEDIVFKFTQAHISQTSEFKDAYEQRRLAYNGGTVLLNLTGHDEVMPETDPWMTASRYGCNAMIDGLPMIFYGQEKGIVPATSTVGGIDQGFELFELNFGKHIVNFKQWNKCTVWDSPPANATGLDIWYGRVNWARLNSPALRSQHRYFLSKQTGGGDNSKILATAKYEIPYASPTNADVVLAFALILDTSHTTASEVYDLQGPWDLLGLDTGKYYNVQNIAASDPSAHVWDTPQLGQDLFDDGIYVGLNADDGQSITNDGALVQYLRIVEDPLNSFTITSTAATNGAISPAGAVAVSQGSNANFTITADPLYRIASVTTNSQPISYSFNNADTNHLFTWSDVQADGAIHATFTPKLTTNNPAQVPELWLDQYYPGSDYESAALGDTDSDNMLAWQEYIAGTDPTDNASLLRAYVDSTSAKTNGFEIRWPGTEEADRYYSIYWVEDLVGHMITNILVTNLPSFYPAENSYTDTLHQANERILYRIKVEYKP